MVKTLESADIRFHKLLSGQPRRRLNSAAVTLTDLVGRLWWLVLAVLSVPLLWRFGTDGLPQSYDGATHLLRLALLNDYIHHGMLYPRWLPELILGNGAPVFNYYAPLTYYVAEGFHLLGASLTTSFMVTLALLVLLAAWGMYLLVRDVFGTGAPWSPLLAATAYMYAPYLANNVFIRGAIAEVGAQAALPWAAWALRGLMRDRAPGRYVASAILSFSALALSHNITLLLATVMLAAYYVVLWWQAKWDLKRAGWTVLAVTAAAAATAFFWAPMILERKLLTEGVYQVSARFFMPANVWHWSDFLDTHLRFEHSFELPVRLGIVQLGLALSGAVLARRRDAEWLAFVGIALFSGLCVGAWALPFWTGSPILLVVQFPWRLLSIMNLALAVLTGGIVCRMGGSASRTAVSLVLLGLIVFANTPRLGWMEPLPTAFDDLTLAQIARYERNNRSPGGANYTGEFYPRWAKHWVDWPEPRDVSGDLRLALDSGNSFGWQGTVTSATGGPLTLSNFYFPGWQATADHQRLRTFPDPDTGLLTVDVPPGSHQLSLAWTGTDIERWATLVGLLVLAALTPVLRHGRVRLWPLPIVLALLVAGTLGWPLFDAIQPITALERSIQVAGMKLVGYRSERDRPDSLLIRPYWHIVHPARDRVLHWQLRDADGVVISEAVQAPYFNTPEIGRWPTGTLVSDALDLGIPADLPDGRYSLYVQSETSDQESDFFFAGPVQIPKAGAGVRAPAPTNNTAVQFDQSMLMTGTDLTINGRRTALDGTDDRALIVHPGDVLRYAVYWQASAPMSKDYRTRVEMVSSAGIGIGGEEHVAGNPFSEPTSWDRYRTNVDTFRVIVPADAKAGLYSMHLSAYDPQSGEPLAVTDKTGKHLGDTLPLHAVKIVNTQAPAPQHPASGRLADVATFLGYDLSPEASDLRPGKQFTVTLYYRVDRPTTTDATRFVQLFNQDLGMAAQRDSYPREGMNPTRTWVPGEIVVDPVILTVAGNARPGAYGLAIGFYDLKNNLQRLALRDGKGNPITDDRFELTQLQVR